MSEKVLITGASGFIGYHLVPAAQQAGLEVHAAVRASSNVSQFGNNAPVLVYPDWQSEEALQKLLEEGQYSYIIHAAGATRAKTTDDYNTINATYTLQLARAAARAAIPLKKFVFMSSLAALGPAAYEESFPFTEAKSPAPVTSYGKSKLLAEYYLSDINVPLTILRPTAVYGPREKDLLVVFKMLSQGWDPYIGHTPQRFSFVYVKDVVQATLLALEADKNGQYNLSDGHVYGRYELADTFQGLSGKKAIRLHLPLPLVQVAANVLEWAYRRSAKTPVLNRDRLHEFTAPNWAMSIEAAQRDLGYKPTYDLKKGLNETLQWYREQRWL
ncbi:MAG: NAD(P)-dependent oxidoreductase [Siphonobacter sp.]